MGDSNPDRVEVHRFVNRPSISKQSKKMLADSMQSRRMPDLSCSDFPWRLPLHVYIAPQGLGTRTGMGPKCAVTAVGWLMLKLIGEMGLFRAGTGLEYPAKT